MIPTHGPRKDCAPVNELAEAKARLYAHSVLEKTI